jgi:PKD repeat protein
MKKIYTLIIFLNTCFAGASFANIYYVINNQVNGTGSLNQAILDANFHNGRDSIYFNIPFAAIADRTITINSIFLLPDITDAVMIDGTSQPAGNPFGVSNAKIQITASGVVANGLVVAADSIEIYGLYINHFTVGLNVIAGNFKIGAVNFGNVINDCTDACVKFSSVIEGSILATFAGIDTSGNVGNSPLATGIEVESSKKITIGGKQPGGHNYISGNNIGIKISNSKFIDLQGNYVGTDATGTFAVPNYTGIQVSNSSNNISIGGDSIKELNVISGNLQRGLDIEMYSSIIIGNYIGTDVTGLHPLGNTDCGIYLRNLSHDNVIGGINTGEANIIAYNGKEAIYFQNSGVKNITMRGNRIYCNSQFSGLGGIVVNGGNQDILPPLLTVVSPTSVTGTSFPGQLVDIYSADSCNKCEGADYLGTAIPDASGVFTINLPVHGNITANCTDTLGNSSAFSMCEDSSSTGCVVAAFTSSALEVCIGEMITFTDLSVTIPNTSITSWHWDFGDGGTSTDQNPSYSYTTNGSFDVTLKVDNSDGCSDTATMTIVTADGVTAAFDVDTAVCSGQPVTFTDQSVSQGGSFIVSWSWTLGDSTTSFFANFDHTYEQSGYDTVVLTVINSNGCSAKDTAVIHVQEGPVADFSFATETCSVLPVPFTDLSTGGADSTVVGWQWDFGDGDTSSAQNPSHIFTSSGTYTVQLIIENGIGCTDTVSKEIDILSAPVASFTYTIDGLTVDFENTSISSSNFSTHWKFGDGGNSTQNNPSHTYATGGVYEPCMVVVDNTCDLNDTICATILITGIEDVIASWSNLVTISPNPATTGITISNIPAIQQIKSLELRNNQGTIISCLPAEQLTSNALYLPLPALPEGIYFIGLSTGDELVMKKVVITNR